MMTNKTKSKIRVARERFGMTQEQLAVYAGLSSTTTSFAERAPAAATPKTLKAIAEALNMRPEDLL